MNIYLDDSNCRHGFLPFTLTRHIADIRIGIDTIREKWAHFTNLPVITDPLLSDKQSVSIPANILPGSDDVASIIDHYMHQAINDINPAFNYLKHPWELFQNNSEALGNDFLRIVKNKVSQPIPGGSIGISPSNIFIEEGATLSHVILNASEGPIYIGKNVNIMEGALIRGPFAANEGAVIKMGAKIYGGTTIGPHCVVGGEIKNSVFFGYSNKAHDGYLGDSVIGEWCNFGAGSSNSNVKNTGGIIKYQLSAGGALAEAGRKAGLLMGDYSRCAINTSFNTGSVVGVCCNIFGEMPGKFTDHFSWGSSRYLFEKAIQDINNWKHMKGKQMSEVEVDMLKKIYQDNY
jgi:UDP-N-acetylglucosamine diphosphorylase / glucose-1-phosphate thymidylyltransferase / UDP-N-acetylgalactosamine diphosphorylase / glucosamine-1-phosphate N-acetyltransferase / galactosamine-1-phosphate N-acetyltransferase